MSHGDQIVGKSGRSLSNPSCWRRLTLNVAGPGSGCGTRFGPGLPQMKGLELCAFGTKAGMNSNIAPISTRLFAWRGVSYLPERLFLPLGSGV